MSKSIRDIKWNEKLDFLFAKNIFPKVVNRALLYGPPGTGKSGYPFYATKGDCERVTLSPDDTPDSLLGFLSPTKTGELAWHDGPAIRAMKQGKILVLDEVDECSPECMPVLNAILDDKNMVRLSTPFGTVKPKAGFAVFATTNKSPNDLRESLRSRFDVKLFADTPTEGVLQNVDEKLHNIVLSNVHNNCGDLKAFNDEITPRSAIAFSAILDAVKTKEVLGIEKALFVATLIFGSFGMDILTALRGSEDVK